MFSLLDKNKAYLLGLLTADGNLGLNTNSIRIELHKKDKQILDDLLRTFGGSIGARKHGREITAYCWSFPISRYGPKGYGNELYEQLLRYGIKPAKTGEEVFATLEENLMPHYTRGLWDGDGSFYVRKRKNTSLLLSEICSASEMFINQISVYLECHDIKNRVRQRSKFNSIWYVVELEANPTKRLAEFLYNDEDCLRLERKYITVQNGLSIPKSPKYWTEEQIDFLTVNYQRMNTKLIAEMIGKTYKAVNVKSYRLKLKKG